MSRAWWHRVVRGVRLNSPAKIRSRRPRSHVPLLERLEDRLQPSSTIPINATNWTAIGPAPILPFIEPLSGRVSGILADPTSASTYYISAPGGGVWKTTDDGTDWTPLTDHIAGLDDTQRSLEIGTLAMGPKDPITGINAIYAGEGDPNNAFDSVYGHGILKSVDGGNTWALLGNNVFDRKAIAKIVPDLTNPKIVYAAVANAVQNGLPGNTGIYKSTDGGTTWANLTTSITTTLSYSDLIMDPVTPSILYAGVGDAAGSTTNGIYKTADGGATWTRLTAGVPSSLAVGRVTLAISQTNSPQTIYASFASTGGTLLNFLKSTNQGTTWARMTTTPDYMQGFGDYGAAILVNPTTATTVYAFSLNAYVSLDGGNTWSNLNTNGPFGITHAMTFDASGHIIQGDEASVWRLDSADPATASWSDHTGDLQIGAMNGIALHPANPNIVYGDFQNFLDINQFNDSLGWNFLEGVANAGYVRVDGGHPLTVYHELTYGSNFFEKSIDGGLTWLPMVSGLGTADVSNQYPPFIIETSNDQRLLLGTDRVYETNNGAVSWVNISTPVTNGWNSKAPIDWVADSPATAAVIYAAVAPVPATPTTPAIPPLLFGTVNNGTSWNQLTSPAPGLNFHYSVLIPDPANAQILYTAAKAFRSSTGGGLVWQSKDGGQSWKDLTGPGLPDIPVNTLLLDPWTKILYAGTDVGVYESDTYDTPNVVWQRLGANLPDAQVQELQLSTEQLQLNERGYILATATHGRGAFELNTVHFDVTAPSTITAGQPFTMSVTALDSFNQKVFGYTGVYTGTVTFTSSDASATLPGNYSFTTQDSDVRVFNNVVLNKPGTQTFSVVDTANTGVPSFTFTVNVLPGPTQATHFTVTAPSSVVIHSPFGVTVSAVNAGGTADTTYTGTISFSTTDNGLGVALPPSYTFTPADKGVHTFANGVTLSTTGTQTISVSDNSTPQLTGSTTVQAGHGIPARLAVSAPSPSLIQPGQPFGITVTALDSQGNVDPDYTGTINFSTSDTNAVVVLPGAYTFTAADKGSHTFNNAFVLGTVGLQTITVKDNNTPPVTGTATVQVPHGPTTKLVISGRPAVAVAGSPFSMTVTALDAFGNVDTNYAGMLTFSSTDTNRAVVLPASYVFTAADKGQHAFANAFKLATAGNQTITIKDNSNASILATVPIQVNNAAASRLTSSGPVTSTVGTPFSLTLTAFDPFGNVDIHYSGTISFTTSDKGTGVVLPANYTFTIADAGQHTFTNAFTLVTTGAQTITAKDTGNASIVIVSGISLTNPAPILTGLGPNTVQEGSAALALTVSGRNFVPGASVLLNAVPQTTTFVSAGQLTVTVPAALLKEEGSVQVSVTNPTPGGGASSVLALTITDAALNANSVEVAQLPGVPATNLVLATFTDVGGSDPVTAYSATITWGDGSAPTVGTISSTSAGFQVTGNHTYTLPGVFPTTVTISDKGGSSAGVANRAVIGTLNQQFVAAAFQSLYGRTVDEQGLIFWTTQLDRGTPRSQMVERLTHTDEYFATIIEPAYVKFLGRIADPDGLAFWTGQMRAGLTDEQLMAKFIGGPEYYAHAGGTDKAWVTAMYNDLLKRVPDQAGINFWVDQLAHGALRADVALGFALSAEHEGILIQADYSQYLGRNAQPGEVNFWLKAFSQGVTNEDVVAGFVGSDEYFNSHTTAP